MPFHDWFPKFVPGWLQGTWGTRLFTALGEELDEQVDELTQAARASMPGAVVGSAAAEGALERIGKERQLERGPGESDADYADRLRLSWDTWKRAGSHAGMLEQFSIAGFDTANLWIFQKSGKRAQLTAPDSITYVQEPLAWTMDGKPPEAYASFGLLFTAAQPSLTWTEAEGFSDAAAKLHRIARRWKPAKAEFWGTQILETGAWYGWPSTRTWGSFNWGGTATFLPPG